MYAVVSHASAFRFLDLSARLVPPPEYRFPVKPFDGGDELTIARSKTELSAFPTARFSFDESPMDILVPDHDQRRRVKAYRCRSAGGTLPPGSLMDAGHGMLVASAPLLFVQLCQGKDVLQSIRIGCNICGNYSLDPESPDGVTKRRQLASKRDLETFLEQARHLRGSRNASAALPWVLEHARSPKEVELGLVFSLPERLGGFGFKQPRLNGREEIDAAAQAISDDYADKIDVYWPDQRFGFEYASYASHGDIRKIGHDQRRALALREMGIHIVQVTDEQLGDPHQLLALAHILEEYGVPRVS